MSPPYGPLAHQDLPSGVTATALMLTGSPGNLGRKTGGVPDPGEQEVSTQSLPLNIFTCPEVPQNWNPNAYPRPCASSNADPWRWNQPLVPSGFGVPSAFISELAAV